jgi:hypothetical protein
VLRRATAEQVKSAAAQSKQLLQQKATRAAGFSQVMELLRESKKPAVGHNVRFDVAYVLAGFVQNPLPKTWSGFKQLVGSWFPGGWLGGLLGRCSAADLRKWSQGKWCVSLSQHTHMWSQKVREYACVVSADSRSGNTCCYSGLNEAVSSAWERTGHACRPCGVSVNCRK